MSRLTYPSIQRQQLLPAVYACLMPLPCCHALLTARACPPPLYERLPSAGSAPRSWHASQGLGDLRAVGVGGRQDRRQPRRAALLGEAGDRPAQCRSCVNGA